MSTLYDAWGSPGYSLLTGACQQAAEHHQAYEQRGHLPDLDRAIAGFSAALAIAVNVDVRSTAANGLGVALWSRYERFGRPDDLDDAIALFRAALAMYPDEKMPSLPAFQSNLAGVLQLRWTRTRSKVDLTEAMQAARAAVSATPPAQSQRCGRLSALAATLLAIYVYDDDSSALAEAIELYHEAIRSGPPGSDSRAWACANLAEALRCRYHSLGGRDRPVLDAAVEQARAALSAAPAKHPLHPRFQSNLALVLLDRHAARGHPADLAEAASLARDAVRATPADHPNRAERLATLSQILQVNLTDVLRRSRQTRVRRRALSQLIKCTDDVVAAVPSGHIAQAGALFRKGWALDVKAVTDSDATAYTQAITCYQQLAQDTAAPVSVRVAAGWRWAISEIASTGGADWSAALAAFELAVNLLPRTAPRRITHADRERRLAEFSGLARDAGACAIQLGQPELALRWLEHGRGVLLGQALDSRAELAGLYQSRPDLARRLEELRVALDLPEDVRFSTDSLLPVRGASTAVLPGEDRHALAGEWDRLLGTIRGLPGFDRFLQPPEAGDLLAATSGRGPVVIVNVSDLRCDALVLAGGRVTVLALPGLNQAELIQRAEEFRSATARALHATLPDDMRQPARRAIDETLEWLWTVIARPILSALGFPPRLWWVPTGPLTVLPLHAAAGHGAPGECVLDRVISSYAPTVRALVSAWQQQDTGPARHRSAAPAPLIVSVPGLPGVPELPGVREETAGLISRIPGCRVLADGQAVRQAVLDALPHHPWAHFACHAVSPADGTTSGHLVLHDHPASPLTVTDLARLRLPAAELAYLSACETSVTRDDLNDEALHMAGACHMAGFRHVVGTLWEVKDTLSPAVAAGFYAALLAAGADAGQAAPALHTAVRAMRRAHPGSAALWASYIHVGP